MENDLISLESIEEIPTMQSPLRQYKFALLWCNKGCGRIEIDEDQYELHENQFLTITPKQFYQFKEWQRMSGYLLKFTYDFFCTDDKSTELIYHNGIYCHFGLNEVINIPENVQLKVKRYFEEIGEELSDQTFEYLEKIHALTKLLIIEVSRCKIIQQQRPLYKPTVLFLSFLNLIRESFKKKYSLKEYANSLNTTESKLVELSKDITGETPQQLINDLVILEAKRLFKYKELSVKEVAFELGFNDPYYFSRFFKKQTSGRPKDYLRVLKLQQ